MIGESDLVDEALLAAKLTLVNDVPDGAGLAVKLKLKTIFQRIFI